MRYGRYAVSWLALAAFASAVACRSKPGALSPYALRVILEVHNSASFDVVVYAAPNAAAGAVRLGTVGAFESRQLLVPRTAMRVSDVLVLQLHAIGTRFQWTTPDLTISPGLRGCLDIYSNSSGDLSRSSFFSALNPDSVDVTAPRRGACGFRIPSVPRQALGVATIAELIRPWLGRLPLFAGRGLECTASDAGARENNDLRGGEDHRSNDAGPCSRAGDIRRFGVAWTSPPPTSRHV